MAGLFITFEGADGCGKTTQQKLLAQYLTAQGREVVITREPGSTDLGEQLRDILLNYEGDVSDRTEQFLFLASRAQHVDMKIEPALAQGKVVLCDRYIDSTAAYQGYGRGLDLEQIDILNNIATNGLKPDITLVFDVDIETSQARVGAQKDRLESAGAEFFNRVRQGYLELAKREPDRIKVIDAARSIEEIQADVISIIGKSLN